ncbi:MAG: nicotinate (nicotinamide) nucleotide adenylyltransferase [Ruminococcus sp.]|nr:nicotinate (nicotinamide) nucleotide adenylyltransferase [Ruminococcus sp.]
MRRAIYGGSFNPIHNDHIKLALQFAQQFELDRVTLIPTNITPLKDNSRIAAGKHRYQMCLLAAQDHPELEVSDIELRRKGESYTSDTIKELWNDDDRLFLIVGADMYMTLDRWHEAQYIFDHVTVLVAPRGEYDYDSLEEKYLFYREQYGCRTLIAHQAIGELSSTMIREGIASGADVSHMIDPRVLDYIQKHDLYR